MEGGALFGSIFFILVTFAAITSSISLLEPAIAWLVEKRNASRVKAAILVGGVAWALGLGSAFSFNIWADFHLIGQMTFFDVMDYTSNNILLPLGGMLIALFAGWVMDDQMAREELDVSPGIYKTWQFLARFIAPLAVLVVFIMTVFA